MLQPLDDSRERVHGGLERVERGTFQLRGLDRDQHQARERHLARTHRDARHRRDRVLGVDETRQGPRLLLRHVRTPIEERDEGSRPGPRRRPLSEREQAAAVFGQSGAGSQPERGIGRIVQADGPSARPADLEKDPQRGLESVHRHNCASGDRVDAITGILCRHGGLHPRSYRRIRFRTCGRPDFWVRIADHAHVPGAVRRHDDEPDRGSLSGLRAAARRAAGVPVNTMMGVNYMITRYDDVDDVLQGRPLLLARQRARHRHRHGPHHPRDGGQGARAPPQHHRARSSPARDGGELPEQVIGASSTADRRVRARRPRRSGAPVHLHLPDAGDGAHHRHPGARTIDAVPPHGARSDQRRRRSAARLPGGEAIVDYLTPLMEERRREPTARPAQSALRTPRSTATPDRRGGAQLPAPAAAGRGGDHLSADRQLLFALLAHPDVYEAVRADRAPSTPLIQETLRWESPVQFVSREPTERRRDLRLTVPAGAMLSVAVGSANRDERHYDRARSVRPAPQERRPSRLRLRRALLRRLAPRAARSAIAAQRAARSPAHAPRPERGPTSSAWRSARRIACRCTSTERGLRRIVRDRPSLGARADEARSYRAADARELRQGLRQAIQAQASIPIRQGGSFAK